MLFSQLNCTNGRIFLIGLAFCMLVYICVIQTLLSQSSLNWSNYFERKPTIFCMISTIPMNHATRGQAVKETWARHCDDYVFITTAHNTSFGPAWKFDYKTKKKGAFEKNWLWERMKGAFRRATVEKMQYDWFLKADDDTFVIVENLRNHLKSYNPNDPIYLGWFSKTTINFPSGGAGYVLSREAVKRFVLILDNGSVCAMESLFEDVEMAKCLHGAGVRSIDAVDEEGKHRMLPLNIEEVISPHTKNKGRVGWLVGTSVKKFTVGVGCCSRRFISMHYVTVPQMYMLYYLIYELQVAGHKNSIDVQF